jgi:DNA-binding transcriptional ArsR family regulator
MTEPTASTIHLDARAIKVLAHPLRSRLLTALRVGGPATATALAATLATNTGATSYHLRRLASVGLVEETDEGRGRERWWRATTREHSWTPLDVAGDPDGEAAADWLSRQYLRAFVERYEAWLDELRSWPADWQEVAGSTDLVLHLTPDALGALLREFGSLVERYRDAPADPAPDTELVQVYLYTFPGPRSPR